MCCGKRTHRIYTEVYVQCSLPSRLYIHRALCRILAAYNRHISTRGKNINAAKIMASLTWTIPEVLHSIEPRRTRPRRRGPRNTYHCCNKGKQNNPGVNICPDICPLFYLGQDNNLYCSWCLRDEWKATAKACSVEDWSKVVNNIKT